MNRRNSSDDEDENSKYSDFWKAAAAVGGVVAGGALLGALIYGLTRKSNAEEEPEEEQEEEELNHGVPFYEMEGPPVEDNSRTHCRRGVPKSSIPDFPIINNLNSLLADIHVRYIALNDDEFSLHYKVYDVIANKIHKKMKEVDPYYERYSSRVQCAGSHYDWLRIGKPDEFDVDIIIGLPLNINNDPFNPNATDIDFESRTPLFVHLKTGVQFKNMPDKEGWDINTTAYKWKDEKHYICCDRFNFWFQSVMDRALNQFVENGIPVIYVDWVPYTIRKSKSGPAFTLYIENRSRGFRMDVDFVPALKFPENRWPICRGYRDIPPGCNAKQKMWMVVPKPNKDAPNDPDRSRSWRLAMHDQERGLMYNTNHMKLAIKYLKKLRDSMKMKEIASYYIKTLFFWEALERQNDPCFWQSNPATLFKIMVKKLHKALDDGNIPYFWNKNRNLIGNVSAGLLRGHARKLKKLLVILDQPARYKEVAYFLLTDYEFREYNDNILHI